MPKIQIKTRKSHLSVGFISIFFVTKQFKSIERGEQPDIFDCGQYTCRALSQTRNR